MYIGHGIDTALILPEMPVCLCGCLVLNV